MSCLPPKYSKLALRGRHRDGTNPVERALVLVNRRVQLSGAKYKLAVHFKGHGAPSLVQDGMGAIREREFAVKGIFLH